MHTLHDVSVELVWPVRPNIEECTHVLLIGNTEFTLSITFPVLYTVADLPLSGWGWSSLRVNWSQAFEGVSDDLVKWASQKDGAEKLTVKAESAQNILVDFTKANNPDSFDHSCIRHFGPIDWPLRSIWVGQALVSQVLGASTSTQFRSQRSNLIPTGTVIAAVSFQERTLRRANDLASSGYPTEASLLAVAVMDSVVQQKLITRMSDLGVQEESSKALLRNTTTKRLATYLDPVMKLLTQHSLREDIPALFVRMSSVNRLRNDAIHNGSDLSREQSVEVMTVCKEVLQYIETTMATAKTVTELGQQAIADLEKSLMIEEGNGNTLPSPTHEANFAALVRVIYTAVRNWWRS